MRVFCFLRFHFKQDDVFGLRIPHDHLAQQIEVTIVIQTVEEVRNNRLGISKCLRYDCGQQVLEKIQRWKTLHFNKLRRVNPAVCIAANTEIELQELGVRIFVPVPAGDGVKPLRCAV